MKQKLLLLLLTLCFVNCKKIECNGEKEKKIFITEFKKILLDSKVTEQIKDILDSEVTTYEAEVNNILVDFVDDLKIENIRTTERSEEINECSCEVNLKLIDTNKIIDEFNALPDRSTLPTLNEIDQIKKYLNKSFKIKYKVFKTDDDIILTEIDLKNININEENELNNLLGTYIALKKAINYLRIKNNAFQELNFGRNKIKGILKIRDLTDPSEEITLKDRLVFESDELIKFKSDEIDIEPTNKIGIYTKDGIEKYKNLIGKNIIINAKIVEDDSGVAAYPLQANIFDDFTYEVIK